MPRALLLSVDTYRLLCPTELDNDQKNHRNGSKWYTRRDQGTSVPRPSPYSSNMSQYTAASMERMCVDTIVDEAIRRRHAGRGADMIGSAHIVPPSQPPTEPTLPLMTLPEQPTPIEPPPSKQPPVTEEDEANETRFHVPSCVIEDEAIGTRVYTSREASPRTRARKKYDFKG